MWNITNVSIKKLIVHVLDLRPGEKTVFSDISIDITSNRFLRDYFQTQVEKVSQDELSSPAKLSDEYLGKMDLLYQKVTYEEKDFIPGSKELAEQLKGIMEKDKRIAPGVLVVCVFTEGDSEENPILALLKLNSTYAIIPHEIEMPGGGNVVTLEVIPEALPTVGEKLQKAALIRKSENPEWEMLVLDRQVGKGEELPAADFFRRFLGAEWILTDEGRTLRVYGKSNKVITELYKSDKPEDWAEGESIYQAMEVTFAEDSFKPDSFINSLAVKDSTKTKIRSELDSANVLNEFKIDKATAVKLIDKVRYMGDSGIVLTATPDAYRNMVEVTNITVNNIPMKRICITTQKWQPLPRRK